MCYTCSQLRCCWCVMLFWLYMYGRGYMRIQYIMYDACYGYSSMCCCTESNVVFPERGRAPSHTPCPNLRIANLRGRVPPSPPTPRWHVGVPNPRRRSRSPHVWDMGSLYTYQGSSSLLSHDLQAAFVNAGWEHSAAKGHRLAIHCVVVMMAY